MSRRIAFITEKGGTGKTTLAVNLSAYWASHKNSKVLLVDMDTQGHAGKCLGVDVRSVQRTVFDFLMQENVRLDDVICSTSVEGLFVLPSYKQMADFPMSVAQNPRREWVLADRLSQAGVDRFDMVVFDSPPSLGLTTLNILAAATEVVVPVALTYLALDGCAEMVRTIDHVVQSMGHSKLHIHRVIPTMYRKTGLADEILQKLKEYFPHSCTPPLPLHVKIDEAQSHAQTIWQYAPWSKGATLLQQAAEDVWNTSKSL